MNIPTQNILFDFKDLGSKTSLFFVLFLFISINVRAQKEDLVWYFGQAQFGIQFDPITKIPSPISGKYFPYHHEGSSVVSDPLTGELYYYSDGIRIVDASHTVMPNGGGLLGAVSCSQTGLSCPVPGNCRKFYLFSNSAEYTNNTSGEIYYSIVDLDLPGNGTIADPLGDIISTDKNILLHNNTSEAMTIIPQAESNEYWMLLPLSKSSTISIFKISASGIYFVENFDTGYSLTDIRNIRYSHSAGKLAIVGFHGFDPLIICNFNDSNGQISNPVIVPGTPQTNHNIDFWGTYDAAWSPDGTKLYYSTYRWYPALSGGRLFQYDLNNPSISPLVVYSLTSSSYYGQGLKLGPDEKIYWIHTAFGSSRYIGVVNKPNEKVADCNFDYQGLDLGTSIVSASKFPEFPYYYSSTPSIDTYHNSMCTGADLEIDIISDDPEKQDFSINIIHINQGSSILNGNVIRYSPPIGFSGNDTIWYELCDPQNCYSSCGEGIIVLEVSPMSVVVKTQDDAFSYDLCLKDSIILDLLKNDTFDENDGTIIDILGLPDSAFDLLSNNQIQLYFSEDFSDSLTFSYRLCETTCSQNCDTSEVIVTILKPEMLFVPNLITPNSDGLNDVFEIKNLSNNTSLFIYNVWGKMLYNSSSYQNNWDGENLSEGIYFYSLKDLCRKKTIKGWIHIVK